MAKRVTVVPVLKAPLELGAGTMVIVPASTDHLVWAGDKMSLMYSRYSDFGAKVGVGTAVGALVGGGGTGVAVGAKVGRGVAVGMTAVGLGGGTAVGVAVGAGGSVGASRVGVGLGEGVGSGVGVGVAVGTGVDVGGRVGGTSGVGDGVAAGVGVGVASGSGWLATSPGEALLSSHISDTSANTPTAASKPKEKRGPWSTGPELLELGRLSQKGKL